jgi:hypothetical protein
MKVVKAVSLSSLHKVVYQCSVLVGKKLGEQSDVDSD